MDGVEVGVIDGVVVGFVDGKLDGELDVVQLGSHVFLHFVLTKTPS